MVIFEKERSVPSEYFYKQKNVNLNFQKHTHYSFELLIVTEGRLNCEIDNNVYSLGENQCLLILPNQIHSYSTPEYSRNNLYIFSVDLVKFFYDKIRGYKLLKPNFDIQSSSEINEILMSDGNILEKISVLYRLCSYAISNSKIEKIDSSNTLLASSIASCIQENYTKDLSLKDIAKMCGCSYNYISTFFNETFKENFSTYVNHFRLQHALSLLSSTNENITEIAMTCGFSTIRNFNYSFKKEFNITPLEYRKNSAQTIIKTKSECP